MRRCRSLLHEDRRLPRIPHPNQLVLTWHVYKLMLGLDYAVAFELETGLTSRRISSCFGMARSCTTGEQWS